MLPEEQPEEQDTAAEFQVPRVPYNETTIVNIISDIYRTYLQLNYISDWEVSWAPEGDHPINEALCEELHIDPVVISLMKQLPYIRFSGISSDIEFIHPYSRAFVYLEDYEIRVGRDPDFVGFDEPRTDVLLPQEIALTCSMDEGIHLILDTKENAIRVWSFSESPPDGSDDYRSYYPHHAPTWLASYLQKLRSLDFIPSMTRYHRSLYHEAYQDEYPKMKKILQEQYGWPYNFREAEWKTVSQVTWQRIHRDDPNYEIDREDEFEPDVLKGGKSDNEYYLWHYKTG
ncbi:hypothetical protein N7540_008677 [Penicillium herquei]|nr:hypothetical protein N7540_008677 [Penicillium herquei]